MKGKVRKYRVERSHSNESGLVKVVGDEVTECWKEIIERGVKRIDEDNKTLRVKY